MSDPDSKPTSGIPAAFPESGDSGKGGDLFPRLSRRIRRFAAQLARDYADDLARDPRGFRYRVVSLFRSAIPGPRPGRPGLPEVTRAIAMRERGEPWSRVYFECIPGYLTLDPTMRQW